MFDVHANGPLTIIPKFFETRDWNTYHVPVFTNACSLLQLAALYENYVGITKEAIQSRLNKIHAIETVTDSYLGPTFAEAFDILRREEDPVSAVGMVDYGKDIKDVIDSVCNGIPILLMIGSHAYNESRYDIEIYDRTAGMRTSHCFIVVGYDAEEKKFILRESRSRYCNDGYIKIATRDLDPSYDYFRFFSIAFQSKH